MRRVKFLIAFLIAFCGLLACADPALAVLPAGVSLSGGKHCNSYQQAVSTSSGTIQCSMNNVVSGDTVLLGFNLVAATAYNVTASGGETFTCPASLQASLSFGGGFVHHNDVCYLVLGSSHVSFTITVTLTAGGSSRQAMMEAWEFAGLGAVDTGSRQAVNAKTVNFTTAANNEFAFSFLADQSTPLIPSGSNNSFGTIFGINVFANSDYHELTATQTTGTAGTYTSSFTSTSSGNLIYFVNVVAFAISGGSPQSAVYVNQQGQYVYAGGAGTTTIGLSNTLANSKIVVRYYEADNAAASCDTLATGETCTCPASASVHHSYSGVNYTTGICYSDLGAAHSGLQTITVRGTGGGFQEFFFVDVSEIVGLSSGADTPSAAAAAAQTVNYTTAAANEWAFGVAGDTAATYPPNLITPGNSFNSSEHGFSDLLNSVYVEGVTADLKVVSSGSNTFSYTMTSSLTPLVAVLAFTPSPSAPKYSMHSRIM